MGRGEYPSKDYSGVLELLRKIRALKVHIFLLEQERLQENIYPQDNPYEEKEANNPLDDNLHPHHRLIKALIQINYTLFY